MTGIDREERQICQYVALPGGLGIKCIKGGGLGVCWRGGGGGGFYGLVCGKSKRYP